MYYSTIHSFPSLLLQRGPFRWVRRRLRLPGACTLTWRRVSSWRWWWLSRTSRRRATRVHAAYATLFAWQSPLTLKLVLKDLVGFAAKQTATSLFILLNRPLTSTSRRGVIILSKTAISSSSNSTRLSNLPKDSKAIFHITCFVLLTYV